MIQNLSLQAMQRGARRLVFLQMVVSLAATGAVFCLFNFEAGYSALVGGLICVLTNSFFMWRFFKSAVDPRNPKQFIFKIYAYECVKLVLVAVLFVLAILFAKVKPVSSLLTYIVVQFLYWLSPILFR